MKNIHFRFKRKWKRSELMLFLEQLSLYVSSGLPIDRALKVIEEGSTEKRRPELVSMRLLVESGSRPSVVFARHLTSSQTIITIIEQGELSGEFGKALASAHMLLEKGDELSKRCLSALAYPVVIGIFAGLLTLGLVRGVMPQIIPLLIGLHVPLPLLTRVVIALSQGLMTYGVLIVGVGSFFIIVVHICYKRYGSVRKWFQYGFLRTPLCGHVLYSYWLAIFLRSCGTLIDAGTPASSAYTSAVAGISFIPLQSSLQKKVPTVFEGASLSLVLSKTGSRLPRYVPALISAGEASGTLGVAFIRAADIVDKELSHALKKLTSLIEPLMMAGMGCAVGAIALSIMLPIYDISRVLQK